MFRIIKIQKLEPIVVIVHTLKDALLIIRSTKLTPSFVEKYNTIFICLVYKVLHSCILAISLNVSDTIRLTLTIILLLVVKGQHNQYYNIPTRF